MQNLSDILKKATIELLHRETLFKNKILAGIPTGLKELDRLTQGWQNSNLIILAARPSMGKTALMLFFAKTAAKHGKSVCLYSLEMRNVPLANRMILSECNIPAEKFRSGNLTNDDWSEFDYAQKSLSNLSTMYIDDNSKVSMNYIRSDSKVRKKKGQCDIIFIDYLQFVDCHTDEKNRNREYEISQASQQAKQIANELNVPVILLCQLSRDVEKRVVKRPVQSDLRDSGAIEQDADIILFIYRPAYYKIMEDDKGNSMEGIGYLILAKNRDGALGEIIFQHNESITQITEY